MVVDRWSRQHHFGNKFSRLLHSTLVAILLTISGVTPLNAGELPELITKIKPSVVAIGTTQKTRRPPHVLMGTGFALGDGSLVVTNAHVVPDKLDDDHFEKLAIFSGTGNAFDVHKATVLAVDRRHDLALLKHYGPPLTPLSIESSKTVAEGTGIAFIGYPIGAVLGLYAVTHTGIISAITPSVIPAPNSKSLNANQIRAMRDPYFVYQLDATAYPGNSGSPLIDINSGNVIGIINKVLVKKTKENLLRDPSDITYAIPASYILELQRKSN